MKEWKGNSNSAHAAIAAHRGGGESMRQEDDFYATDPEALQKLLDCCSAWLYNTLDMIKPSKGKKLDKIHVVMPIWECACGNGNLVYALRNRGYSVLATDIKDRGCGLSGVDFLKADPIKLFTRHMRPCVIITNPPYSFATEFIEHALEILPEYGLYIALMNITYLAGQARYKRVYSKGSLREVYVFSKRVECWKNGERPKDKCGSIANYAWYVFQKGYKGQPTIYWL